MGRRKGQDIDGWLVVDKPAGPSSAAVVNKVRWALGAAKAGHAGTLDPAATGVLAVALGEATKTAFAVEGALKAYRFVVRWGQATATDDAEGEVVAMSDLRPDAAAIRAALGAFRGAIRQVPPAYSAVKVDGQRAYALARAGEAVELAARELWVERLELLGCPDADHSEFELVCGKGGYVRAIGRDLGAALGCLGHVLWLRRVWSGPFRAEDAVPFDGVEDMAASGLLLARVLPLEVALGGLTAWPCPPEALERLSHGNPVPLAVPDGAGWVHLDGQALALGQVRGGLFQPDRLLRMGRTAHPTLTGTGRPLG